MTSTRDRPPGSVDGVTRVTSSLEWTALAAIVLAMIAVSLWSAFGSLDRNVTVEGAILRGGERHAVLSGTAGTVAEVLAGANDTVVQGAPIARLYQPELEARISGLRSRIDRLEQAGDADEGSVTAARLELAGLTARRVSGEILAPFAGTVTAMHVAVGEPLKVGTPVSELRRAGGDSLEVVIFVPGDKAERLREGMRAQVEIDSSVAGAGVAAEIVEIATESGPPPAWFSRISGVDGAGATLPPRHRIRLALLDELDNPPADAAPCRVHIILETVSLFELVT